MDERERVARVLGLGLSRLMVEAGLLEIKIKVDPPKMVTISASSVLDGKKLSVVSRIEELDAE